MNLQLSWRKLPRTVFSLVLLGLLSSCGSSDNAFLTNETTGLSFRFGSGTGTSFLENVVAVADNGSTSTVSVNFVDDAGNLLPTSADYEFSSTCVDLGQALFDNSSVTTDTGSASAVYTNTNCTADNTFTVTATVIDTQESFTASSTVTAPAADVRLGTGSGSGFVNDALNIAQTSLGAIDSTALSVNIVDADGNLITDSATVSFSSNCVALSQASITPDSVTTSTGTASTTYNAAGCEGTDTITATTTLNGITATASSTVTVAPVELGDNSGSGFVSGSLILSKTTLNAVDTADISVNLADTLGNLITSSVTINFTSNCIASGQASLSNTSVTTTNGSASTTYTTNGCSGSDTVTATATFNGKNLSATGTLTIASFQLGNSSSGFTSGTLNLSATQIAAAGDVTVTANLVDFTGNPYTGNTTVIFSSPCVSNNDASLSNTSVNTSNGTASTIYSAGTCSDTDTITATASTDGITLTATADVQIMPNRIGSASDPFTEGAIDLGLANISIDGNTSVTVRIIDFNGNPVTSPHTVTFSSQCTFSGDAKFSDSSGDTNTDNTITGIASLTYTATGCVGSDVITVTTQSGSDTLTATGTLNIAAAALGSIEFTSVTNSLMSLKGLGTASQPETTTVTYTVLDAQGQPVSGEIVNFSLDTAVGGLTLATTSGISDGNGQVSVVVQSGTSPTTFRVNAVTNSDATIASQSSSISVATGPATQNSLSISADILNPEGYDYDGETVSITARVADRYGNPIQDGTSISFTTEGGAVQPNCITSGGACSVTWTSQVPRPTDGRVSVLAHLTGEENFTDNNSNGIFDDGDIFNNNGADEIISTDDDLPEAFRDDNENGLHDTGEFFVDFDGANTYTTDDSLYSGPGCNRSDNLCSGENLITIFKNITLVMAESFAQFTDDITTTAGIDALTIANGGSQDVTYTITGITTGQVMPVDTIVKFSMSGSSGCSISSDSSYTVASTSSTGANTNFFVRLECNGTPGTGTLKITVSTPNKNNSYEYIDVTQQ